MLAIPPDELARGARYITIETGETKSPSSGNYWILLGGAIKHVTGTNSAFYQYAGKASTYVVQHILISSATGSGTYPMYSSLSYIRSYNGPWPMVILDTDSLAFDGGTASLVRLQVYQGSYKE